MGGRTRQILGRTRHWRDNAIVWLCTGSETPSFKMGIIQRYWYTCVGLYNIHVATVSLSSIGRPNVMLVNRWMVTVSQIVDRGISDMGMELRPSPSSTSRVEK